MKIEYQNGGMDARLIITWTIFSLRKHSLLVSEILLRVPGVRVESDGFFMIRTYVSGGVDSVLCAELIAEEQGYEVVKAQPPDE
ncbi:hypothetical protein YL93_17560 [Salmonella enterica subsp. enterica serovar Montevideo]|nr:hypothetical protein [Salmonella enterica subsp. salamae]ECM9893902.1 hypothetical protein [Salmonella enterica subsp. enterica serovar Montevideo]